LSNKMKLGKLFIYEKNDMVDFKVRFPTPYETRLKQQCFLVKKLLPRRHICSVIWLMVDERK